MLYLCKQKKNIEAQIISLEDLKRILSNPLNELTKGDVIKTQEKFKQIARSLFEDFAIQCGEKQFRFAEIEFYYYKQGVWDEDWNKETYPRNNKKAGELFYHYSGVDICFASHFNKDNTTEFGGILIRSLLDGNEILAEPLYCANFMLNMCQNNLPMLIHVAHKDFLIKSTKRCNIKSDYQAGMHLNLCYFADTCHGTKLDWTNTCVRETWNKNLEKLAPAKRNYLIDRKF